MGEWADSLVEGQIMTATGCGRREAMGYLSGGGKKPGRKPKPTPPIPDSCRDCGTQYPSRSAAWRCFNGHRS